MTIKEIPCNPRNYNTTRRDRAKVKYIVIHFTAVDGDTAENEGKAFQKAGRHASAHFFIDRAGNVVQSVNMWQTAWAVGGKRYTDYKKTGGAKYYGICTNSNSVSIELCDIYTKHDYPSDAQVKALCELITYIRKYCRNIVSGSQIIRHFDVTGKYCPRTMCKPYGNNKLWSKLKAKIVKECFNK